MIELLNNKLALIISALLGIFIIYKFLNRKSNDDVDLENEYNDILKSDKYKVKSQYD